MYINSKQRVFFHTSDNLWNSNLLEINGKERESRSDTMTIPISIPIPREGKREGVKEG